MEKSESWNVALSLCWWLKVAYCSAGIWEKSCPHPRPGTTKEQHRQCPWAAWANCLLAVAPTAEEEPVSERFLSLVPVQLLFQRRVCACILQFGHCFESSMCLGVKCCCYAQLQRCTHWEQKVCHWWALLPFAGESKSTTSPIWVHRAGMPVSLVHCVQVSASNKCTPNTASPQGL